MTVTSFAGTGASSSGLGWDDINWHFVQQHVRRLQMRIAKATEERRWGKVQALQRLLTHSFYAKLLAVKRVTSNRGARTPGVDGLLWKTPRQKFEAAMALKRRGYRPQPLRRIYIAKKNHQQRPLGIPSMADRAFQALHWFALEPVSETVVDGNAYGFRPKRGTADAIAHCFTCLSRRTSPQWILEGDIKSCFDQIDHTWLVANTPMDRVVLRKWLQAGYMDKHLFYPTEMGTPQGGIISPTLMLMTLRGLQAAVGQVTSRHDQVHVIAYADDFIITGVSKRVLVETVRPAVEAFLAERGLQLSLEKTLVTRIDQGFDFLGFNVRKYNGTLLIKPAKQNIAAFLERLRNAIKSNPTMSAGVLIGFLNPMIRGWANYYRHVVSKKIFSLVDRAVFAALWRWSLRRHPKKGVRWVQRKYFPRRQDLRQWVFGGRLLDRSGSVVLRRITLASATAIRRHIKVRSDANPYASRDVQYFIKRSRRQLHNYLSGGNHPYSFSLS